MDGRARLGLALLGGGIGSVVLGGLPAHAFDVHTVGDTTTADFSTIGDAITAAAEGDVIVVVDQGTYSECLTLDKRLTLMGSRAPDSSSSGPGSVLVECSGASPALTIDAATVVIAGMDFTHRSGRGAVIESADATLVDVTIQDVATTSEGAGLFADASDVVLHRVTIDGAVSSSDGGGMYLTGSDVELRDVTVRNSEARNGGGILAKDTSLDMERVTLDSNTAVDFGGGLQYESTLGSLRLRDSRITGNSADSAAGAYIASSKTVETLVRVTFDGNDASSDGGGLYGTHAMSFEDCLFKGNTADGVGGGAILSATAQFRASTFDGNEALGSGGGLYLNAAATLTDTAFISNQSAGDGGGLYVNTGSVNDNDGLYETNTAKSGGGVYANSTDYVNRGGVFDTNTADSGNGGGLWINANNSSVRNYLYGTTFIDNLAKRGRGGGLYVATNAYMRAYGIEVTGNTADIGGGMFVSDLPRTMQIYESRIHGNDARLGGGLASVDSALDTSSGTYLVQVNRSRIYDNTASEHGGGIYTQYTGVQLYDSWLYENASTLDGGGWYSDSNLYSFIYGGFVCANDAGRRGGGLAWVNNWGFRRMYGAALVDNDSTLDGGGAYVTGLNTASGYRSNTDFYYHSVLGNHSASTLFDGIHHNNTGTSVGVLYSYYGHHGYQAHSSNSQASSSSTNSIVRDSTYFSGRDPVMNNPTYKVGDSYGNVSADPRWGKYTSGNCFDDVLSTSSYTSYGANALTGPYGRRNYTDGDGDGQTIAAGDCDDSRSDRYTGNTEVPLNDYDEDCVGWDDRDADDDGFAGASKGGTDCDDSDASIHPGATETWYDKVDSDCDGWSDNDQDRDGFDEGVDCDDEDPSIHPGAIESAFDGVDQDCDDLDMDLDDDGYMALFTTGDGSTELTEPAEGEADCAAGDAEIHPGAEEIWYDGVDQDCDAADDYDQDGDGDRSAEHDPDGLGTDCDDTDPEVSGLAEEVYYDGVDANCDGKSDFDADQDGDDARAYGGGDCDDEDDSIYTGAPDILDFDELDRPIDNDCDFKANPDDDGDGVLNWYEQEEGTNVGVADSDGDTIPDGVEWPGTDTHEALLAPLDSDSDGTIDALDTDSDGDGLPDKDEAGASPRTPRDTDGDGVPDYRDDDDDGDGLSTADEIASGVVDTDGDGLANHLDPDSDNDGVPDGLESGDRDGDGVPDYLDAGGDWGEEAEPTEPAGYGFGLGCSSTSTAPLGLPLLLLPGLLLLRRRRR